MDRTVPSEQQDRTNNQQQQTSLTASGVLDKLFGKQLLQARHYIMSRKSWLKMVPTENCDILMTFPDSIDDHTLLWLLNHIRVGIPQVSIQVRQHKHTQAHAFFITTTFENLLRGAEQMSMHKAVKPQFGGGMRRFSCEEDNIYENIESELCFFTSQVRVQNCGPHELHVCVAVSLLEILHRSLFLGCYERFTLLSVIFCKLKMYSSH
ncbi:hypothetical protein PAMA_005223 [Pampus argenteus]